MKRSPMPRKRATPRVRRPERVQDVRIKPKAGEAPSAAEKHHHARLRAMPCLVSRIPVIASHKCAGRVTLHHVSSDGYKRIARSHRRVVPLCERHHQIQHGPHESVEALGHRGFTAVYGIDLLAEADRLWLESENTEGVK